LHKKSILNKGKWYCLCFICIFLIKC
jgi:hypothetical protein